jgi:hypothetical protein
MLSRVNHFNVLNGAEGASVFSFFNVNMANFIP